MNSLSPPLPLIFHSPCVSRRAFRFCAAIAAVLIHSSRLRCPRSASVISEPRTRFRRALVFHFGHLTTACIPSLSSIGRKLQPQDPLAAHGPFGPHRGVYERYSTKHEADRLPLARALSPQTGATPHAARRFLGGLRRRRFLGANFRTPSLLGGSGGAMASSNGKRGGAGRTHARAAHEAGDDADFRASCRAGF